MVENQDQLGVLTRLHHYTWLRRYKWTDGLAIAADLLKDQVINRLSINACPVCGFPI